MKKITLLFIITIFYSGYSQSTSRAEEVVPVIIEAETGKFYRGAKIQDCETCSDLKHVNDIGGPSTESGYFTSIVTVLKSGTYKMNLSFSSGDTRKLFISSNGTTPVELTLNSGGWSILATKELDIQLNAGTNTIKFYNYTDYAPNVDKFTLALTQESIACSNCFGPYEAESGVIIAPAAIQDCDTCSGNQQVGDMGFSDRYFTKDVMITTAGTYRVYVSFSSGSTRSLSITANETTTVSGDCNSIDWGVVFVKSFDIVLASGNNTLKFHNPGDWAPNIDKFRMELVSNLGTNDFSATNLSVYPNPTNAGWNVRTDNASISSVTVFDISGKEVMSMSPNSNEVLIDAKNLKKGLYITKVTTENGTKSFKLFKD